MVYYVYFEWMICCAELIGLKLSNFVKKIVDGSVLGWTAAVLQEQASRRFPHFKWQPRFLCISFSKLNFTCSIWFLINFTCDFLIYVAFHLAILFDLRDYLFNCPSFIINILVVAGAWLSEQVGLARGHVRPRRKMPLLILLCIAFIFIDSSSTASSALKVKKIA